MTRSGRVIKPNPKYVHHSVTQNDAYATNLKKLMLLEDRKDLIKKSIEEEIDNLMGPGVMEVTPMQLIRYEHRKEIINLLLFHKEKRDPKGVFIKDKCRIVTLSQVRDTSTTGQTYSPMVNPTSLFILLANAATLPQLSISAYDVKGAFLNSPIPEDTHVYVRVDEELSKMLTERYKWTENYLNDIETHAFRLRRYLHRTSRKSSSVQ
jgi:hypothetical protein